MEVALTCLIFIFKSASGSVIVVPSTINGSKFLFFAFLHLKSDSDLPKKIVLTASLEAL